MAGIIKRDDIVAVRERSRIEDVVGEHVTLKPAGMDSLKGLCPFHDERTPSFHVRPSLGMYHCFGCGQGGDVINFIQEIHHLPFVDAVEMLAAKVGVTLHYEEGGTRVRAEEPGKRQRLLDAHRIAQEFYAAQLMTPEAHEARTFIAGRGFTPEAAAMFGLGYSPSSWDALTRHLRSRGFTDAEIIAAGLGSQGNRGVYDRFRDRVMWPIRDITGATVGFGARRLDDSDKESPKYLNSPETAIYKKAQVLYGLDLAKKHIAQGRRVVIVEGYTDVMAAHFAGIPYAVATCGTAFGHEHAKIIRRLLGDSADPSASVVLANGRPRGGEVIFTFDGDEAGQKAALRAYAEDQTFAAQTFVAVEPHGLDPCDLRLAQGDAAVRALVESRTPLFQFVLTTIISSIDLRTVEGRVSALRQCAPIVAGIRDRALRREYTRELAGWLGMEVGEVSAAVRTAEQYTRQQGASGGARPGYNSASAVQGTPGVEDNSDALTGDSFAPAMTLPPPHDPVTKLERQALEVIIQRPGDLLGSGIEELDSSSFTVPVHQAVFDAVRAVGGVTFYHTLFTSAQAHFNDAQTATLAATRRFSDVVRDMGGELLAGAITELAVAPLPQVQGADVAGYARGVLAAMARMDLMRRLGDQRAKLQRMSDEDPEYTTVFTELMRLEERRQRYSEYAQG